MCAMAGGDATGQLFLILAVIFALCGGNSAALLVSRAFDDFIAAALLMVRHSSCVPRYRPL